MVLSALFPPYRGIPRGLRHPDMGRHGTPHLSACGRDVDGSITIEGKGICTDCFKRFGLEEKLRITIEELFEVKE